MGNLKTVYFLSVMLLINLFTFLVFWSLVKFDWINMSIAIIFINMIILSLTHSILYRNLIYNIAMLLFWSIGIGGVIYYIYTENTAECLVFIILAVFFTLFSNLHSEFTIERHLEYYLKRTLYSNLINKKYQHIDLFDKKYYKLNKIVLSIFSMIISIFSSIVFIYFIILGLQSLESDFSNALSMIGIGLGSLGVVGIFLSIEQSRSERIESLIKFYPILENNNRKYFENKLDHVSETLINLASVKDLLFLIAKIEAENKGITDLEVKLIKNIERDVKKLQSLIKESESSTNIQSIISLHFRK